MHRVLRVHVLPKDSAPQVKLRKARAKATAGRLASRCSAEALPAAPAAKEVDAGKNENGVIDTCDGREKKATGGGKRFSDKAAAGKCVILSVGLLIFGRLSGPGKAGKGASLDGEGA